MAISCHNGEEPPFQAQYPIDSPLRASAWLALVSDTMFGSAYSLPMAKKEAALLCVGQPLVFGISGELFDA